MACKNPTRGGGKWGTTLHLLLYKGGGCGVAIPLSPLEIEKGGFSGDEQRQNDENYIIFSKI